MRTLDDQPLHGPMVWHGRDLARSTDWIRSLSAVEIDEIDAAVRAVERRGLAWRDVRAEDFPLPRLAATLAQVSTRSKE